MFKSKFNYKLKMYNLVKNMHIQMLFNFNKKKLLLLILILELWGERDEQKEEQNERFITLVKTVSKLTFQTLQ